VTAIKEANQGLARKVEPCVLCSYEVACDDIADLRTQTGRSAHAVAYEDMACAWSLDITEGREPSSWGVARRLIGARYAGILVPSFARGATDDDENLVLWSWSDRLPYNVEVFDPSGRLPKNQLSWD
jgi:RES domain-containing protein